MVKAILFDLDNTLYDERDYVCGVLDAFCVDRDLDYNRARIAYLSALEHGVADLLGAILDALECNRSDMHEALFRAYRTTPVSVGLFDDAHTTLEVLREHGIRIGVLTNGVVEAQRNKVACLGIEKLVDRVVYARAPGRDFEKPHPSGYRSLMETFNVTGRQCLFVGDTVETDIAGAVRLEIPAVRIARPGMRGTVEGNGIDTISRLDELLTRLEVAA